MGLHARHAPMRLLPFLAGCVWFQVSAGGCAGDGLEPQSAYEPGDASFGNGASEFPREAGAEPDATIQADGGQIGGPDVRVRLLHGVLNLGALHVCYDPDLVLDDPDTETSEFDPGPLAPRELALSAAFASASDYLATSPIDRGVLSVHRAAVPEDDAGVDAGTGPIMPFPSLDAGLDTELDAGAEAGSAEAGAPAPGPATDPCSLASAEVLIPLPTPIEDAVLDDAGTDAGPTIDRGLLSTLPAGATVTLIGSGLALDPDQLAARADAAGASYLREHPGDADGAARAARMQRATLEDAFGPRVLIAEEPQTYSNDDVQLALVHMVPDVPSAQVRSGGLRLCVTTNTLESGVLPEPSQPGFVFRERRALTGSFSSHDDYLFRVFEEEAFDMGANDCATTSLQPVATLEVNANTGRFEAGRSYTLAVLGALEPDLLCAPTGANAIVRGGCPLPPEELAVRIVVLDDAD